VKHPILVLAPAHPGARAERLCDARDLANEDGPAYLPGAFELAPLPEKPATRARSARRCGLGQLVPGQ
jgi:hypothetical protein